MGFSLFSFSLFVPSLMEEFQGSRAVVTLGFSLMFSSMTLVGPFVGRMLDTKSVRGLMVTGAVINASCLALMSRATELWQLGVLFGGGIAIGTAMLGPLASATVVTRWFDRQRGRAQGLVNMGGPAGGLLGAPLGGYLLATYGWRSTVLVFSATTLIVIPVIWLVVRNRPEDLGQAPDGVARDPAPQDASATTSVDVEAGEWTTVGMFRFPGLWLLGLAIAAIASTGSGWGANLAVYAEDLGIGIPQVGACCSG
jgi:MFS family permease